ncbi:hypothetical protein [Rummeliibacillus pycnus]|uniref:hypothetical protein n=1 Tax=Rummeliibacillus pycnus TaxID=101070 RepID=UPI0014746E4F|nr:hypothetical protein [Rummeliibacillus pycnus]
MRMHFRGLAIFRSLDNILIDIAQQFNLLMLVFYIKTLNYEIDSDVKVLFYFLIHLLVQPNK